MSGARDWEKALRVSWSRWGGLVWLDCLVMLVPSCGLAGLLASRAEGGWGHDRDRGAGCKGFCGEGRGFAHGWVLFISWEGDFASLRE